MDNTVKTYTAYLISENVNPNTIRSYLADLKGFTSYLSEFGIEPIPTNITSQTLNDFKSYLESKERKPATINRAISTIRTFCDWCVDQGLIKNNPARKVKGVRASERTLTYLDQQAQAALVKSLVVDLESKQPPKYALRNTAIIYTLLYCGPWAGELCAIKLQDIKLHHPVSTLTVTNKYGRTRTIPLHREVEKVLGRYIDSRLAQGARPNDLLFTGQRGPVTPHAVRKVLKKCTDKKGINIHPHMLRNTFISNMLRVGATESEVALLVGQPVVNPIVDPELSSQHICSLMEKI